MQHLLDALKAVPSSNGIQDISKFMHLLPSNIHKVLLVPGMFSSIVDLSSLKLKLLIQLIIVYLE